MSTEARPTNPGVRFPPVFLFFGGLGLAWLLETQVARIRFIGAGASTAPVETAGAFLMVLGVLLIGWGLVTFTRARTGIMPTRSASKLVDHGPYRVSRNPMYTGMSLLYLGAMLILNWAWALVIFPFVLTLLYRLVISREEAYLLAEFGDEYRDYCRRVRRWI